MKAFFTNPWTTLVIGLIIGGLYAGYATNWTFKKAA